MAEALAIYLHDHLAGSCLAIDLLGSMCKQHRNEPLGEFAAELLGEIEQDQSVLKDLIQSVGSAPAEPVKQIVGGLMEKATRLKWHRSSSGGVGVLEKLEVLALGILKQALWQALERVSPFDERLSSTDFHRLITRAATQHQQVEERRLDAAQAILSKRPLESTPQT